MVEGKGEENSRIRRGGRYLKKIPAHLYATQVMKYEFMEEYRSEFTVVRMCKAFRDKESGYYRWRNKKKTARQTEDESLTKVIKEIHQESKETYGPVRILKVMKNNDVLCSIGRTRRLMRENGLYSISKKKFIHYNDANMDKKFSENILNRDFVSFLPNEVWCGDITYVKAVDGWVYLSVVMDLFNREIIGYALSKKANSQLTIHAMADALMNRKPQSKIMFHSDRGSQYSSKAFTRYLDEHNISSSMSPEDLLMIMLVQKVSSQLSRKNGPIIENTKILNI